MPFVQWIMHKLFYERGGELFIAVVAGFLAYISPFRSRTYSAEPGCHDTKPAKQRCVAVRSPTSGETYSLDDCHPPR